MIVRENSALFESFRDRCIGTETGEVSQQTPETTRLLLELCKLLFLY